MERVVPKNLWLDHRKIKMTESNTKCRRYLKKITCKGTLRQAFYLPEAPSPPMTPYSRPLGHYTLCECIQAVRHEQEISNVVGKNWILPKGINANRFF
jgi:hypothetical protein